MLTRDGDDDYDDKLMMISGHSKVKLEFSPPPFFSGEHLRHLSVLPLN